MILHQNSAWITASTFKTASLQIPSHSPSNLFRYSTISAVKKASFSNLRTGSNTASSFKLQVLILAYKFHLYYFHFVQMFSVVMSRLREKVPGPPTAKTVLHRLQLFPLNLVYYYQRNTTSPHFYTILTNCHLRIPLLRWAGSSPSSKG